MEAGWTRQAYEEGKGNEETTFEEQCTNFLKAVYDHENSWPFRTAVSAKQAPDYYTVITEPMWLEKIKENQELQEIANHLTRMINEAYQLLK